MWEPFLDDFYLKNKGNIVFEIKTFSKRISDNILYYIQAYKNFRPIRNFQETHKRFYDPKTNILCYNDKFYEIQKETKWIEDYDFTMIKEQKKLIKNYNFFNSTTNFQYIGEYTTSGYINKYTDEKVMFTKIEKNSPRVYYSFMIEDENTLENIYKYVYGTLQNTISFRKNFLNWLKVAEIGGNLLNWNNCDYDEGTIDDGRVFILDNCSVFYNKKESRIYHYINHL